MIRKIWLPEAIKLGIDYDTFWKLNPSIIKMYEDKRDHDIELFESNAWLLGLYVQRAVAPCISPKAKKYPDKPLGIWKKEEEEVESDDALASAKFLAWAKVFNKNFESR